MAAHRERGDGGAHEAAEHDGERRGPRCRAPHLRDGALAQCRDEATASRDPTAAEGARARCLAHAFADRISEPCAKAEGLCADPAAPSDVCARVTAACSSAAAADAGI